jgi:DNA-directed RNA polymerase specialized sigma24 family protein
MPSPGPAAALDRVRRRMGTRGGYRTDLAAYLTAEYARGAPWRVAVPCLTRDGYALRDVVLEQRDVAAVLRGLPRLERRVLALRFGEHLGEAAIRDRLGLTTAAYHRARLAALDAVLATLAARARVGVGPGSAAA